ncbi:hypothetical protein ABT160_09260 [Streptomyces sp. NPDC001941]|uniref:hypothetical protein n=1 Tax=Streptomyces sp. NPDC001941 TaxID=3154659 RepID=UPI003330120E
MRTSWNWKMLVVPAAMAALTATAGCSASGGEDGSAGSAGNAGAKAAAQACGGFAKDVPALNTLVGKGEFKDEYREADTLTLLKDRTKGPEEGAAYCRMTRAADGKQALAIDFHRDVTVPTARQGEPYAYFATGERAEASGLLARIHFRCRPEGSAQDTIVVAELGGVRDEGTATQRAAEIDVLNAAARSVAAKLECANETKLTEGSPAPQRL